MEVRTVYDATDLDRGRPVAIHALVDHDDAIAAISEERFMYLEALCNARLDGEHVLLTIDFGKEGRTHYGVTEPLEAARGSRTRSPPEARSRSETL
jgi:hypothetical protein